MKRITFLSIIGLVLLFLLFLSFGFGSINFGSQNKFANNSNKNSEQNSQSNSQNNNLENNQNNKILLTFDKLEIAKTVPEQQKGLMFRDQMCQNCGMIFEFENEDYRSFWMKNTWIDLDIIYINGGGQIINIQNAKAEKSPKSSVDYPTYPSLGKAKYVLEVNAGFAKRMKMIAGNYLQIDKLLAQTVAIDNSYNEK